MLDRIACASPSFNPRNYPRQLCGSPLAFHSWTVSVSCMDDGHILYSFTVIDCGIMVIVLSCCRFRRALCNAAESVKEATAAPLR